METISTAPAAAGIDPRLQQLSYSSIANLHACPRLWQLIRLNSQGEDTDTPEESLTFAFGHAVGTGIQELFTGASLQQTIWNMFVAWPVELFLENPKQNKSFWVAMTAVQQFHKMHRGGAFTDYELVTYAGKPAIELGYRIDLGDGFAMRGYLDAVLQNTKNKKVVVLELKTSSAYAINPATYKNSSQALGYSIVLDVLFPALSSYDVLYFIFRTKNLDYEKFAFTKSYVQRALWIQELLLEKQRILLYAANDCFPMHGENCVNKYSRECKFLNICTMSTSRLITPLLEAPNKEPETYDVELTIQQVIDTQILKSQSQQQSAPSPTSNILPGDTIL